MREIVLDAPAREGIGEIQDAQILIGVPSYNNARTIGHVVRAVWAGIAKYFPEKKTVLFNSDGGSTDGTMEIVKNTGIDDFRSILLSQRTEPFLKIAAPYSGIPGKGSAFKAIFEMASQLNVEACIVVDSDLRSITPEWVELLLKPVLKEGFDYVAPLYHRHKFDGTITNSIIYPLTRALYGKRIRQPIGGDFGFSGEIARYFLTKDVWETDVARFGIDIWMTTTAIANNYKVCQSFLGAKIHDAKDPGADLSSMMYQVVGSAFDLMDEYEYAWKMIKSSQSVPVFGFEYAVGLEPISVNLERMIERFQLGVRELSDLWKIFMPRDVLKYLEHIESLGKDSFNISDDLWVDIIYNFALAMHNKIMNKEHLLKSLTPLYIGRTASFFIENWTNDAVEVEQRIEGLCKVFEERKENFLRSWK